MLKRKLVLFVSVLLLFVCSTAYAGEKALFPTSEFKVGYEGMYMYYDEPNLMHEKGFMNGGFGSWTGYFTQYNIMANAEVEGVLGTIDYIGQYSDGTPLECDTDNYFVSGRATVGMGFGYKNIGVTPYIGFGVRHWYNKIKATGGYERDIHQYYMPIGVNLVGRLDDGWAVGGTLEGDVFLGGTVKSKLSQVSSFREDAENTQNSGSGGGMRVSAFLEKDIENYTLGVEPYFRYWHFDQSETDTVRTTSGYATMVEPENKFYMSGVRLYIKFELSR